MNRDREFINDVHIKIHDLSQTHTRVCLTIFRNNHLRTLGVLEIVVLGKDLAGQIQHRQRAGNADSSTRSDDSQVPTTDCG